MSKTKKVESETGEPMSKDSKAKQILQIKSERPNLTANEIAKMLNTTEGYVRTVLSRYGQVNKGETPGELEPLDEMDYLKRIISSTWGNNKSELIISLFQDHDPNDLRILYSLLNKAQCPKTASELIIYSWAKHRHISPSRVKEMFKDNKSMLRTFKELGYFMDEPDDDEDEEETEDKSNEKPEDIRDMLEEMRREKLMELKRRMEELRLQKEMRELEKQLKEYEEPREDDDKMIFEFDDTPAPGPSLGAPIVTRKVTRPAINPVTGEVLRDENGNIIFETVEEPVDGSAPMRGGMDDTMRWILAMQQQKKEDPEKELLRKEIEELKKKMEEEERRKKEEEEKRRYEEQIRQLQEQMQKFQEQTLQMIQALQQKKEEDSKQSFEQQLLLKLLEDKSKVPPEVMQIIQEEREIIKKLQEQPKDDEEKKLLLRQIEEMKKAIEKKEMEEVFGKYNQYITALYQRIESLEKNLSQKAAMSDDKYKVDKILEMDQARVKTTKDMIKDAMDSIVEPVLKMSFEQMRQQDYWNKYRMLLEEEQRRGLPPGTLIDKFFGSQRVTEDEKRKLLEKIDKEMGNGA